MSSVIMDFFHNLSMNSGGGVIDPKYLLKLRVKDNEIVDLAGNSLNMSGIGISNDGLIGRPCIIVNPGSISFTPIEPLGTEDFTISFFIKVNTVGSSYDVGPAIISLNTADCFIIGLEDAKGYELGYTITNNWYNTYGNGSSWIIHGNNTIHHVAAVRKNNIFEIYLDGQKSIKSIEYTYDLQGTWTIGRYTGQGGGLWNYSSWTGLLDDFCIIKGKALWTEDFTPPTTYLPDKL